MEREKIVPNGTGTVLLKITTNPTNGKLYLAYKGEDKISVWDPNTKQVSDLLTRNGLDNLMDVKFDQYNNMYAVCRNSGTIKNIHQEIITAVQGWNLLKLPAVKYKP